MSEIMLSWFLLPAVVLVVGLIAKKFPPKKINNVYGYRTKRSRMNQATWDFANRYFADTAIKLGVAEILVVLPVMYFFWNNLYVMLALMIVESLSLIALMVITEAALRKHFDENGMKKRF